MIKEKLQGNATLHSNGWVKVDEIGRSGQPQPKSEAKERLIINASHLKKVTMVGLSHAILSMSTRTRELSKIIWAPHNSLEI